MTLSLCEKTSTRKSELKELSASVTCFTGAGNAVVRVLGSFEENVSVDSDSYRVKICVVPSGSIAYDVILGLDFLRNVEICMDKGEIVSVRKAICSDEQAVINECGVSSANDEEQNDNERQSKV